MTGFLYLRDPVHENRIGNDRSRIPERIEAEFLRGGHVVRGSVDSNQNPLPRPR